MFFLSVQYLSNADERLRWQADALPADDLCTENAIMLKRFNRYPLIIDPSGQATAFIMNEYKDRKISKTRSVYSSRKGCAKLTQMFKMNLIDNLMLCLIHTQNKKVKNAFAFLW